MIRRVVSRLKHLLGARRSRAELDEEIAFHIDALEQDLIRQGMDPREARRQARIRFGTPERVQERVREERGLLWIDETLRHGRTAARGLRRRPLFAVTFVTTLGLCIGIGTAVFNVVDAVLWRPLPFPDPGQLAHAVVYDPAFGASPGNVGADGRAWERIRDEGEPLLRAVYSGWVRGVNLTTDEAAAFVGQQRVSAGYFRTLGVEPLLGREFTVAEDVPDGPPVAILSHGLWSRTFGADPAVLGNTIRLKGEAHTVVGVMPPELRTTADAELWTPLGPSTTGEGSGTNYALLVRVPAGMSFVEADARVAAIEAPRSSRADAPETRFGLVSYADAQNAGVRLPMVVLMAAVALMLVVGCANLAGLQIARMLARRTELATRHALGSGTGTLVRQTLVENVLLGLVGGFVGLALAYVGTDPLEELIVANFGIWQDLRFGLRSVAFGALLSLVATILFAAVPLLQATGAGAGAALAAGARVVGGRGHRIRKALLVGQVTLVTALLFAAATLVRSYGHLQRLDPGFEPEGVLSVQFSLDDRRYAEAENVLGLVDESLDGIRRIPGTLAAGVALSLPYERPLNMPFRLVGDDRNRLTNAVWVSPGLLDALRIPLLQGRALSEADRVGSDMVALVNQAFVDAHFEDGAAVGARVDMSVFGPEGGTIVGVVGNVQQSAGWGDSSQPVWETPTIYFPVAQAGSGFLRGVHVWFAPSWVIRSAAQSDPTPAVTQVFRRVDPELPVARVAPLTTVMAEAFALQRFEAAFLIVVGLFAVLLAGLGLYGIVAHEVLERRSEMGLRMALGASPKDAVWSAAAGGLRLSALGLLLGAAATFGVAPLLGSLVWGVAPNDPVTVALVLGALAVLATAASLVPAAGVGRLDPAAILRES